MKVGCISLKHHREVKTKLETYGQDSEKPEDVLVHHTLPFLLGLSFPTQTVTDLKHQNLFHLNTHTKYFTNIPSKVPTAFSSLD